MAAARPVVSVYSATEEKTVGTLPLPDVLVTPIRQDIVHRVHTSLNKNHRQSYGVNMKAGMQQSAISWGTGRAVSRIPRICGGGTHRSGQGAFGNQCRGGRMFNPTKQWRKWTAKSNNNERRVAVCSALAASSVPALLMARGHRISTVQEVPLVISNEIESMSKTKEALSLLKNIKAIEDIEHVKDSKKIRRGTGKMRNRRYVERKGPLLVYASNNGIEQGFRNIPGMEIACVDRLNLLKLAPGGHLGRFVIWTQAAFEKLDRCVFFSPGCRMSGVGCGCCRGRRSSCSRLRRGAGGARRRSWPEMPSAELPLRRGKLSGDAQGNTPEKTCASACACRVDAAAGGGAAHVLARWCRSYNDRVCAWAA